MSESTSSFSATSLREMNRIVRRPADGSVTAASLFALWILIPLALGALAYVLIGVWLLMSPFEPDLTIDWKPWMALTLLLQAGYWAVVSRAAGRSPLKGLWGLVPVVALVPTFTISREALIRGTKSD